MLPFFTEKSTTALINFKKTMPAINGDPALLKSDRHAFSWI
jgi:hypothetical protein